MDTRSAPAPYSVRVRDDADVVQKLSEIAAALTDRAAELTADLVVLYERELAHLVHDDESVVALLTSSVYQNIDTAVRIFEHAIDPRRVEAPAAAIEYARRLAQRGTPITDIVRAYYLGLVAVLDHALGEAARHISDPDMLTAASRRALTTAFTFIDRVTIQVVSEYQEERDRWLRNRSAVRAARVRALLADGTVDVDTSEAALGYRLRGHHVGMIAWYPQEAHPSDPLTGLEAVAQRFATGQARPLFVPHDELCAWVWLPVDGATLPRREHIDGVLAEADGQVRVAFGDPGYGLDGFRRTHRQALRVHVLATAAGRTAARAMRFRDVGAAALMTSDLAATRLWVEDTLGPLAVDDEAHERMRETLRVFLAAGGSYTAAAARLTMHKNSVQYRVRKAEELLGRPVSDGRLDTELALNLCHLLGQAVLKRP